jgi:hypothetical protein
LPLLTIPLFFRCYSDPADKDAVRSRLQFDDDDEEDEDDDAEEVVVEENEVMFFLSYKCACFVDLIAIG